MQVPVEEASGHTHGGDDPSVITIMGQAQDTEFSSWHVQVVGQSLSTAHEMGLSWHSLTGTAGQAHAASTGATMGVAASSTGSGTATSAAAASSGTARLLASAHIAGPPGFTTPTFEVDPPPLWRDGAHSHGSGMHVNPDPQSESTLQGRLYLGVHVPYVYVVQVGGGGVGHDASGSEHFEPLPAELQLCSVVMEQAIPSAQSESTVQDARTHVSTAAELHSGAGEHSSPFAQAGVGGQDVTPDASHLNPLPQSTSVAHDAPARAWTVAKRIPPASVTKTRRENCREWRIGTSKELSGNGSGYSHRPCHPRDSLNAINSR
jgi:hypothetical protein